jgi:hypothetical protein
VTSQHTLQPGLTPVYLIRTIVEANWCSFWWIGLVERWGCDKPTHPAARAHSSLPNKNNCWGKVMFLLMNRTSRTMKVWQANTLCSQGAFQYI